MHGYCVPAEGAGVALVTELGDPLSLLRLLQLHWLPRVQVPASPPSNTDHGFISHQLV